MKLFTIADRVNTDVFTGIIDDMTENLNTLSESEKSGHKFAENDIKPLCISLTEGQRDALASKGTLVNKGSWCIAPVIDGMQSEERVDFIFKPTYIAISILTLIHTGYPDITDSIKNFRDVLKSGYDFAAQRDFNGHGYESQTGVAEAMTLFKKGGVIDFILSNPDFSKDFYESVIKTINYAEYKNQQRG